MAKKRKSLGQLLKDTFLLLQKNLFSLANIVLVVYLPMGLLFFGLIYFFKERSGSFTSSPSVSTAIGLIVLFSAFITVFFLATMMFSIAMIKKIRACDESKALTLGGAYRASVVVLGPFCIVSLWVFLKVMLWSLLLIIPGVIFAFFYSFAQMAVVLDQKKGTEALVFSRKIIQPFFWEFVGKSLAAGVIFFISSIIFNVILSRVFPAKTGWDPIWVTLLMNFINGFLSVFPLAFGYFLYQDLKERGNEGVETHLC